jgi:amino acid transporter
VNESNGAQDFLALFRSLWRLIRGEDRRGRKVKWLFSLLRPYRKQVVLTLVALVLATAATLAPPALIGASVSAALNGHSTTLALLVAALLGAALVVWGTSALQTYLVEWVGERALQDLRTPAAPRRAPPHRCGRRAGALGRARARSPRSGPRSTPAPARRCAR